MDIKTLHRQLQALTADSESHRKQASKLRLSAQGSRSTGDEASAVADEANADQLDAQADSIDSQVTALNQQRDQQQDEIKNIKQQLEELESTYTSEKKALESKLLRIGGATDIGLGI